ncbi:MAG: OmpA family protein [Cyanophyceae cyanobacterium]
MSTTDSVDSNSAIKRSSDTTSQDSIAQNFTESSPENGEIQSVEDGEDALEQLRVLLLGNGISHLENQMGNMQGSLNKVEHVLFDSQELLDRLVPIGVELISREISESRDEMCDVLAPIIDRLIYERGKEDLESMGEAISLALPSAIQAQIESSPETLARVLGPEISAAIRTQMDLKHGAIAEAIAAEMGEAIQRQIELDRDVMVDALYPIIGGTINKYLQEVINDINEKVSDSLSPEGIKRKVRARMQGVSEAELILRESSRFSARAAFLIHKESGLVIAEAQSEDAESLESDMLAGMLTAIRSFAADCVIADDGGSELNEIEYGSSRILLEVAGYCYVAVIASGEVPKVYLHKLRNTFGSLVQNYRKEISEFEGDLGTVPEDVTTRLSWLIEQGSSKEKKNSDDKESFPVVTWALGGIGVAIVGLFGFFSYQNYRVNQLETAAIESVAQDPTLGLYNLTAALDGDRMVMRGRVPSDNLRILAEHRMTTAVGAIDDGIAVDNQVRAVNVPPNPTAVAAEVHRTIQLFNQREGVNLDPAYRLRYDPASDTTQGEVTVNGSVGAVPVSEVRSALATIPGVDQVVTNLEPIMPKIGTRLYFSVGSANVVTIDRQVKLTPISNLLKRSPQVRLKIIGYSPSDETGGGQGLALERSRLVRQDLIERGIAPNRLEAEGRVGVPEDVTATSPDWAGRSVAFQAIP